MLGVLPGIIGSIQALEAIKLILDLGDPLIGRLLAYDSLEQSFRTYKLQTDPANEITWENRDRHRGRRARRALHAPTRCRLAAVDSGGSPLASPAGARHPPASFQRQRAQRQNPLPEGALPVAVGLVVNGAATFAFLGIANRTLDEAAYSALERVLGAACSPSATASCSRSSRRWPGRCPTGGPRASAPDRSSGGPRSSAPCFSARGGHRGARCSPRCSRARSTTTACSSSPSSSAWSGSAPATSPGARCRRTGASRATPSSSASTGITRVALAALLAVVGVRHRRAVRAGHGHHPVHRRAASLCRPAGPGRARPRGAVERADPQPRAGS